MYHSRESPLLPYGFLRDLHATYGLLLPIDVIAVKRWYQKQVDKYELESEYSISCITISRTELQFSQFYHDRLVLLKRRYDEARPRTLAQWWYDRRDTPQWFTIVNAILILYMTLCFGMLQCILGGIQAYASWKQMK